MAGYLWPSDAFNVKEIGTYTTIIFFRTISNE